MIFGTKNHTNVHISLGRINKLVGGGAATAAATPRVI
jgi:hypothetical protein